MMLQIGKKPPPIGGVTIHVTRLLDVLKSNNLEFNFYDLSDFTFKGLILACRKTELVHLHTSNSIIRLFISLFCRLKGIKLIITYHGNIGRWGFGKNIIDYLSIIACNIPIVLNDSSLLVAKRLNKNSLIISAFIPPTSIEKDIDLQLKIESFSKNYIKIYCTNAFNVTFDKNNAEIYGISSLVSLFSKLKSIGLIFSDPSGNYLNFLKEQNLDIPSNILIISYPHSFYNVMDLSDGVIRATTTDGDSLTVKESLHLGKRTIASDCVSRPQGVEIYKTGDWAMLKEFIEKESNYKLPIVQISKLDGSQDLMELYKKVLSVKI